MEDCESRQSDGTGDTDSRAPKRRSRRNAHFHSASCVHSNRAFGSCSHRPTRVAVEQSRLAVKWEACAIRDSFQKFQVTACIHYNLSPSYSRCEIRILSPHLDWIESRCIPTAVTEISFILKLPKPLKREAGRIRDSRRGSRIRIIPAHGNSSTPHIATLLSSLPRTSSESELKMHTCPDAESCLN